MNRRGFLATLFAGATMDPERALWVPGKKLISIPPPPLQPIHLGIDFVWDHLQARTSAEYRERFLAPAVRSLAKAIGEAGPRYRMEMLPVLPYPDMQWHVIAHNVPGVAASLGAGYRHISGYDLVNNRFMDRLDVMLVPR